MTLRSNLADQAGAGLPTVRTRSSAVGAIG